MKVALIGYGKMGKAIEEILLERRHEVVAKLNHTPTSEEINGAEVAIEFTQPDVAVDNIKELLYMGIPVVSGTTGWLDRYGEVADLVKQQDGSFLTASNFSLGVNLFFEVTAHLAQLMNPYRDQYQIEIEEVHHTQKLDAPSGTAISIAETIINHSQYENWSLDKRSEGTIPVTAKRIDQVPGTHTVEYVSDVDTISITHTAHSRKGFALGAVIAAEWIKDKKGIFSMKDVLGLTQK
ncbi:4-hydroxy-tetrahydrodipicolinate reductase [Vaginella massiliensis]|uniref:4-hydroxy-tetrahydrodipicolinate reductase n=1 Tax=Vaginella massiliensis TaxID=1816680 RepID=UPI003752B020